MKTLVKVAIAAAALSAFAGSANATHKGGKCVIAGGEATMVTQDLAKFMAGAALKNSMAAHGWAPHGPVRMKCDTPMGLPHCMARQRACG